jgi:hypothetical protein
LCIYRIIYDKVANKYELYPFSDKVVPKKVQVDQKNRLAHNEFTYKKTKDTYKLGDRFLKKENFQSQKCKIKDKKRI